MIKKRNALMSAYMLKLFYAAFCVFGVACIFSCDHKKKNNDNKATYPTVEVTPVTLKIEEQKKEISNIIKGSGEYSVTSENETIATAILSNTTITVTGIKEGNTNVIVKDKKSNKTASIQVIVIKKKVNYPDLEVEHTAVSLNKGENKNVKIIKGSGEYSVTSENEAIAKANLSGNTIKIIAINKGSTNIIITDINSDKTVSIQVTVIRVVGPDDPTVQMKFIEVSPPPHGITIAVEPSYELPTIKDPKWFHRGVFVKDRKVVLTPYKIAETEVTYGLWEEVFAWAENNGYKFSNEGKAGSSGSGDKFEPVTAINWYDAVVWCNAYTEKLKNSDAECCYRKSKTDTKVIKDSKNIDDMIDIYCDMSKAGYRLPTEAEWEFAARYQKDNNNGNADKYGDIWLTKFTSASGAKTDCKDKKSTGETAWFSDNSDNKTHNVKEKNPNALGLYDMSGNVNEWCWDWRGNDVISADDIYTIDGAVKDPQGPKDGIKRARRGGAYNGSNENIIVGLLNESDPRDGASTIGFRPVFR